MNFNINPLFEKNKLNKVTRSIISIFIIAGYLSETTCLAFAQTKVLSNAVLSTSQNNSKTTQTNKEISNNFPKNENKIKQDNKINSSLLLKDEPKENIVSNAFNFKNLYGSSVDSRTGSYEFHSLVANLASANGGAANFNLEILYLQNSSSDIYGIGKGWAYNLTHYNSKTAQLTLSNGGTFRIKFDSNNKPYLQYYKLNNLRIERGNEPNHLFILNYKDGHKEFINNQGYLSQILYPRGDNLSFNYTDQNILESISSNGSEKNKISLSYDSGTLKIASLDSQGNKIVTTVNRANNLATSIELPKTGISNGNLIVGFKYNIDPKTNSNLLTQVNYPTGLTESLSYTSLPVPTGGPVQWIHVVKTWTRNPGFAQPVLKTNYSYGGSSDSRNFMGYASGIPYIPNVDNLYERPDNYNYSTREDNGITAVVHTYNKFHIETDKKLYDLSKNKLLQEVKMTYPDTSGKNINDKSFPANYELPIKTESISYNSSSNSSRSVVTYAQYDDYGNELSSTNASGIIKKTSYCPIDGDINCPKNTSGFVNDPEIIVTLPSFTFLNSDSNSLSPKAIIFTYKKLTSYANQNFSFFVPIKKESAYGNISQINNLKKENKLKDFSWNIYKTQNITYNENISDLNTYSLPYFINDSSFIPDPISNLTTIQKKIDYTFNANTRSEIVSLYKDNSQNRLLGDEHTQFKTIFSAYNGSSISDLNPAGTSINRKYDALGRVISETILKNTSFQQTKTYNYLISKVENSLVVTSPNGYQTKYYYDGLGREIKKEIQDPQSNQKDLLFFASNMVLDSTTSYDSYGRVNKKTKYNTLSNGQEVSNSVIYIYDSLGRNIRTDYSDGTAQITNYDDALSPYYSSKTSYIISQSNDSKLSATREILDNAGHEVEKDILDATGAIIISKMQKQYDGFSREFRKIDSDNHIYETNYDDYGNAYSIINPNGNRQYKKYDMLGNSIDIGVYNSNNTKTSLGNRAYNSFGKISWELDSYGNKTNYTYDKNGNLIKVQTANGNTIHYVYDSSGINLTKKWVEGDIKGIYSINYTYDPKTNLLSSLQDATGTTNYSYFLNQKMASISHSLENSINGYASPSYTLSYKYDRVGNLISVTDFLGNVTNYNRDFLGHLVSVNYNGIQMVTYFYDEFSRLSQNQTFNSDGSQIISSTSYQYNIYNQLISLNHNINSSSNNSLLKYDYVYFSNGLLQSRIQSNKAGNLAIENYSYDNLNNLKEYNCKGNYCPYSTTQSQIQNEFYTFDEFNNISSVKTTYKDKNSDKFQNNTTIYFYDSINPNRLLSYKNNIPEFGNSQTIIYDKENHIISDDFGNKLSYDPMGHMVSFTSVQGQYTRFGYDGNGLQVWEQAYNQEPIYFIYSGNKVINEEQGNLKSSYLFGIDNIAKILGDKSFLYYSYDQSHNVVATFIESKTSHFPQAKIIDHYFYTPYGLETSLSALTQTVSKQKKQSPTLLINQKSYGFDGQRTDSETGFQFLGNGYRAYNPILRRFMAYDSMSPFDKGGINGYIFASNNPILFQDPSGHSSQLLGWIIGAVIGISTGILTGGMGEGAGAVIGSIIANAIAGAGASVVTDVVSGEKINWKNAAIGAVIGAAADGVGYGIGRGLNKALATGEKTVATVEMKSEINLNEALTRNEKIAERVASEVQNEKLIKGNFDYEPKATNSEIYEKANALSNTAGTPLRGSNYDSQFIFTMMRNYSIGTRNEIGNYTADAYFKAAKSFQLNLNEETNDFKNMAFYNEFKDMLNNSETFNQYFENFQNALNRTQLGLKP